MSIRAIVLVGLSVLCVDCKHHSQQSLADHDFEKHGDLALDAKGMQGKFERFDVVANAAFATRLAKIWDDQAKLARIRVDTCERGGIIDVSDDEPANDVRYDFVTFGGSNHERVTESHDRSEQGSSSRSSPTHIGLQLRFRRGELTASSGSESPPTGLPPTFACPLDKLAAVIATANLQTYALKLRQRTDKGRTYWRWEAEGKDGGSIQVCDDTCTPVGTPGCP